jgi:hypothetical protein
MWLYFAFGIAALVLAGLWLVYYVHAHLPEDDGISRED